MRRIQHGHRGGTHRQHLLDLGTFVARLDLHIQRQDQRHGKDARPLPAQ
ncbi:hypothetical protein MHZ93_03355 [Roseomonas sp. ACRSG]|nr:hypothetical protein [Roseomonas sp. ACRSG]